MSTAALLVRMGTILGAMGVRDERPPELVGKSLSPEVPTTDSLATEHFLNTPQAEALIDLTVSQSEWLSAVTVKPRNQRAGTMPRLVITDTVTEGVSENAGATIATHPDTDELEYNCAKYQATWFLTLEDVEEARASGEPDFDSKVRTAFAKAMGNDMARAALRGDNALDSSTRLNRLLRQRDGWIKQARANAHRATTTRGTPWSRSVYPWMISNMPDQFADDPNLRWLLPRKLDESYVDYAQGLGDGSALRDRALLERVRYAPQGIPGLIAPQFPTDQGFATLNGTTADADSIADDGDGTLTARVDTLFGGYDSDHAGRKVKITCDATGQSETLTVVDSGTQLLIHSAGSLGQVSIDTTASHYTLDMADCTGIILTNPRNLYIVLCRRIRAYRKWEQEAERWRIDVYYEADYGIFQSDALVLQEGIVPVQATFGS